MGRGWRWALLGLAWVGGAGSLGAPAAWAASDDPALSPATPAQDWAQEGARLLGEGALAQAEGAFRAAIAQAPRRAALHAALALCLNRQGRHTEALAPWAQAEALDREGWSAPYHLGWSLGHLGRWAEAEAAYQRAWARAPQAPQVAVNLGAAQLRLGQAAAAEATLKAALKQDPRLAPAWLNLALAQAQQGQANAAQASLAQALAWRPDWPEALALRAQWDAEARPTAAPTAAPTPRPRPVATPGLWPAAPSPQALALAQRAFAPTQAQALALWRQGRPAEAQAMVQAWALRLGDRPEAAPGLAWLAQAKALSGEGSFALALGAKLKAQAPEAPGPSLLWARLLLSQGRLAEAQAALAEAEAQGAPQEEAASVGALLACLQGDGPRWQALQRGHASSRRPVWLALGALWAWRQEAWAQGRQQAEAFAQAAPWHPDAPWFWQASRGPWRVALPPAEAWRLLALSLAP